MAEQEVDAVSGAQQGLLLLEGGDGMLSASRQDVRSQISVQGNGGGGGILRDCRKGRPDGGRGQRRGRSGLKRWWWRWWWWTEQPGETLLDGELEALVVGEDDGEGGLSRHAHAGPVRLETLCDGVRANAGCEGDALALKLDVELAAEGTLQGGLTSPQRQHKEDTRGNAPRDIRIGIGGRKVHGPEGGEGEDEVGLEQKERLGPDGGVQSVVLKVEPTAETLFKKKAVESEKMSARHSQQAS